MGTFSVELIIANPSHPQLSATLRFLVDTGSTWTWIPRPTLEALQIRPRVKRTITLADGGQVIRDLGEVLITIEEETLTTPCVLGDEGDLLLLGAVTLEQFGLGVDPVRKVLVPVAGFRA